MPPAGLPSSPDVTLALPAHPVTVVRSDPPAAPRTPNRRRRWTLLGSAFGLVAGLTAATNHFLSQPAAFESTTRVRVTGPAPAGDAAAQAALVRSRDVLDRAAQKVDDQRPFEVPPDKAEAARVAFLTEHLSVAPDATATGPGSTLTLTFRGPHPADSPKYLRAIVDGYRAELASRPLPAPPALASTPSPAPAPRPAAQPAAPPPSPLPDTLARIDAEERRVKADLGTDTAAALETRLAASRPAAEQARAKLRGVERDLARILATGPVRADRLATMEALGVTPDGPAGAPVSPAVQAEIKATEDAVRELERRRAELGQRLGPDHRDMRALADQIAAQKARLTKAAPAETLRGPDELDRHRAALEADRATLAAQVAVLAEAVRRDEARLGEVTALTARLEQLAAARRAQEPQPQAKRPEPVPEPPPAPPVAPPVATAPEGYAVQTVSPPVEGVRVSQPPYLTVVPGGLAGLLVGGLVGFFTAVVVERKPRPRRVLALPAARTPRPPKPARVALPAGPKLNVPLFAQVPPIRPDAPAEKKSVDGLSAMLVSFGRASSPEAEAFRAARRELTTALQNRGHQAVVVTSPGPGDGKSTVAANFAVSLAQAGKRVILVDCDLRNPRVQTLFRLGRLGDSLKSVMTADVDLRVAVRSCEVANLFLLPAGRGPMDPLDLLTRPKFRELIADFKEKYEYVILDAPAATAERELAVLASQADGAVLVVRPGADAAARCERATAQVTKAGTRVLGAVVNSAPAPPDLDGTAVLPADPTLPAVTGAKKE